MTGELRTAGGNTAPRPKDIQQVSAEQGSVQLDALSFPAILNTFVQYALNKPLLSQRHHSSKW